MKLFSRQTTFCVGLLAWAAATVQIQAEVLSFDQAKQRADAGDALAQAVVALHYQLGWNTQKNPRLAAKYAIASAEAGQPLGQFRLGALLRAGEGVPKDEEQGLALQSAAFNSLYEADDPYSITSAAIMIFQGKVVGQDVSQAERRRDAAALYKKAAGMGYAPAVFNYAMCAEAGPFAMVMMTAPTHPPVDLPPIAKLGAKDASTSASTTQSSDESASEKKSSWWPF